MAGLILPAGSAVRIGPTCTYAEMRRCRLLRNPSVGHTPRLFSPYWRRSSIRWCGRSTRPQDRQSISYFESSVSLVAVSTLGKDPGMRSKGLMDVKNSAQIAVRPGSAAAARIVRVATSGPASVILGAIGLALLSQVVVPLPFTPVPVSMGTLGAMLLGVLLGPRRGGAAAALYAIGGAAGLPILAGFASGYMLTSFGYVLGYIVAAVLLGFWVRRARPASYMGGLLMALVGGVVVYVCGVSWMIAVFGVGLESAITLGVLPFLLGDVLKALVIAGVIRAQRA